MSRTVHLLGRPQIEGAPGGYHVRSRKSWALLAYLILSERPPTRSQLATLLFDEADDPLGALRWGLSELRRALGDGAVVEGDPVVLRLARTRSSTPTWSPAGRGLTPSSSPRWASTLLEGLTVRGDSAFDSWLLSEQRRLAAASEEILHEAALASLAAGNYDVAIGYAVQLVAMTPLDENHHALLIRLYRLAGRGRRRPATAGDVRPAAAYATGHAAGTRGACRRPRDPVHGDRGHRGGVDRGGPGGRQGGGGRRSHGDRG